jgi:hypothetical protein
LTKQNSIPALPVPLMGKVISFFVTKMALHHLDEDRVEMPDQRLGHGFEH